MHNNHRAPSNRPWPMTPTGKALSCNGNGSRPARPRVVAQTPFPTVVDESIVGDAESIVRDIVDLARHFSLSIFSEKLSQQALQQDLAVALNSGSFRQLVPEAADAKGRGVFRAVWRPGDYGLKYARSPGKSRRAAAHCQAGAWQREQR